MAESGAWPSQGRFLLTRGVLHNDRPYKRYCIWDARKANESVKADTASKWWCNKRVGSCENKKDPV